MSELTRYRFNKVCRAMPLLTELQAAGVAAGAVLPGDAWTDVDLDPDDFDRAATVVAAHNPAAVDAADQQAAGRLAQARQVLRNYVSNAAPSNADTVAAVKALILAVHALAQIDH